MTSKYYRVQGRINVTLRKGPDQPRILEFMLMECSGAAAQFVDVTEDQVKELIVNMFGGEELNYFINFNQLEFMRVLKQPFGFTAEFKIPKI